MLAHVTEVEGSGLGVVLLILLPLAFLVGTIIGHRAFGRREE